MGERPEKQPLNSHGLASPWMGTDGAGAEDVAERRAVMRAIAHANEDDVDKALSLLAPLPEHTVIRAPEIGLVMVRGRIGGDGAPFNLGEATVTRAAVRLTSGEVGHAYILGRAPSKARAAALIDAIWQTAEGRKIVEERVVAPLLRAARDRETARARRTAATRVEFFTMVRGEDQ